MAIIRPDPTFWIDQPHISRILLHVEYEYTGIQADLAMLLEKLFEMLAAYCQDFLSLLR